MARTKGDGHVVHSDGQTDGRYVLGIHGILDKVEDHICSFEVLFDCFHVPTAFMKMLALSERQADSFLVIY